MKTPSKRETRTLRSSRSRRVILSALLPAALLSGCGPLATRELVESDGGAGGDGSSADGGSAEEPVGGSSGGASEDGDGGSGEADGVAGEADDVLAAAGAPSSPECANEGEWVCGLPGTAKRSVCRHARWQADDCEPDRVCVLESHHCLYPTMECQEKAPREAYCVGTERIVCNEDRSEAAHEQCPEKCSDGECIPAACGDGEVQAGEECDDGNTIAGDGCRNNCTWGPKKLVLGRMTSCAVFGNGWAKCWGANAHGQLGVGDLEDRGDQVNEMGPHLPYIRIEGEPAVFSDLAVGWDHACGIVDGTPWCWGSNSRGKLGTGPNQEDALTPQRTLLVERSKAVAVGPSFSCALLENGGVKCWGLDPVCSDRTSDPRPEPRPANIDRPAVTVQAGVLSACALLDSGDIRCWGCNQSSQLGVDKSLTQGTLAAPASFRLAAKIQALSLGSYHACALSGLGVTCWGANAHGELGDGTAQERLPGGLVPLGATTDGPIVLVKATQGGACALSQSNQLKCWGRDSSGALAQPELVSLLGDIGDAPNELEELPPIDFGTADRILSFDAGDNHGCALFESGTIRCWGANDVGQLGVGHTAVIGDSADELGINWVPTQIQ